jgi:hypothetical protein
LQETEEYGVEASFNGVTFIATFVETDHSLKKMEEGQTDRAVIS